MFSIPVFIANEMPQRPSYRGCPLTRDTSTCQGLYGQGQDIFSHPSMMFPMAYPKNQPRCCERSSKGPESRNTRAAPHDILNDNFCKVLFANLFGEDEEKRHSSPNVVQKSKETKPSQRKMSSFLDIIGDVLKKMDEEEIKKKPQTWQQIVDCSGFKSENISVKVSNGVLIVRGTRDESSPNGTICSTKMEKLIKLPLNVDTKRIVCRFLSKSKLFIEAEFSDEVKCEEKHEHVDKKQNKGKLSETEKKQLRLGFKILPDGRIHFGLIQRNDEHEASKKSDTTETNMKTTKTETTETKSVDPDETSASHETQSKENKVSSNDVKESVQENTQIIEKQPEEAPPLDLLEREPRPLIKKSVDKMPIVKVPAQTSEKEGISEN